MELPQIHPLLLRESEGHYNPDKQRGRIYEIEKKLSLREMIGATKMNIMKYEKRAEKGQILLDEKKLQTYMNYKELLEGLIYEYEYEDHRNARNVIDERYPDMLYYFPCEPPLPGLEHGTSSTVQ